MTTEPCPAPHPAAAPRRFLEVTPSAADAKLALRTLLRHLGEDPDREGLLDTPARVLRSWKELFAGYGEDPAAVLGTTFDADGYDELVLLKDIPFHSTCEHHMLPFTGVAHVGYLPEGRVVGLSKLARLVDCYARRLQIQERLTRQVAGSLMSHVHARGAAVVIEAHHGCMSCRGARKSGSTMVTYGFEGAMREPDRKAAFLAAVRS